MYKTENVYSLLRRHGIFLNIYEVKGEYFINKKILQNLNNKDYEKIGKNEIIIKNHFNLKNSIKIHLIGGFMELLLKNYMVPA